jgi:hypothetical protein
MKKFYFLLLTILGTVATMSAQELNVYYGDKLVKNGDVITVSEPHTTPIPGIGSKYEFSSGLYVEGDAEADLTIHGEVTKFESSYDGMALSLCPANKCSYLDGTSIETTFLYDPSNGKEDAQLHLANANFANIEEPVVDVELDMTIYYSEYPETTVKFKLVFCNDPNASVSSVAKDSSVVRFANNNLYVNLDSATNVEVFSATGARVKVVKGVKNAAINMSNLQTGIYFYRAGKKTGKFIVK